MMSPILSRHHFDFPDFVQTRPNATHRFLFSKLRRDIPADILGMTNISANGATLAFERKVELTCKPFSGSTSWFRMNYRILLASDCSRRLFDLDPELLQTGALGCSEVLHECFSTRQISWKRCAADSQKSLGLVSGNEVGSHVESMLVVSERG